MQQEGCEKFKEHFQGSGPCSHPCLPLEFFKHLPRETSPHECNRCLLPDCNQAFAYFWVCLNLTKNPSQNNEKHLNSMYRCCYNLDCVSSCFAITTGWSERRVTQIPSADHNFACSVPKLWSLTSTAWLCCLLEQGWEVCVEVVCGGTSLLYHLWMEVVSTSLFC